MITLLILIKQLNVSGSCLGMLCPQLPSFLEPLWRHAYRLMQVHGVLRLLLVCILGVQATPVDSWGAREPLGPKSPTSLPAASSRVTRSLYNPLELGWDQQTAQPEIKADTAGHGRGTAFDAESRLASCGKGNCRRHERCLSAASKAAGWGCCLGPHTSDPHEVLDQGQVQRRSAYEHSNFPVAARLAEHRPLSNQVGRTHAQDSWQDST